MRAIFAIITILVLAYVLVIIWIVGCSVSEGYYKHDIVYNFEQKQPYYFLQDCEEVGSDREMDF